MLETIKKLLLNRLVGKLFEMIWALGTLFVCTFSVKNSTSTPPLTEKIDPSLQTIAELYWRELFGSLTIWTIFFLVGSIFMGLFLGQYVSRKGIVDFYWEKNHIPKLLYSGFCGISILCVITMSLLLASQPSTPQIPEEAASLFTILGAYPIKSDWRIILIPFAVWICSLVVFTLSARFFSDSYLRDFFKIIKISHS